MGEGNILLASSCLHGVRRLVTVTSTEEDLDRQPVIAADLKAVLLVNLVNLSNLLIGQAPALEIDVGLDTLLSDTLGQHTPALLDTPSKENLLHSLALGLGELGEAVKLVKRRVATTEGRIGRSMNALRAQILDKVGGWVTRMKFDLVNGWNNLELYM